MQKVVIINLNGNAYHLEEDAYSALSAYIERAESHLRDNPDRREIVGDLEQAIADKCARYLGPGKNVITAGDMTTILDEMGPVHDESAHAGAGNTDLSAQNDLQLMLWDLAHSAGAYVFYHSDGAIRPIIPDMIAAGIDILNPLQWRCRGMEREGLKRDFGDQVVLHGGVDNQHTLAFGSVDEVRAEVLENLAVLGKGGGYILAPCHNIQPISPPENVVAMFETCYAAGWQ